MGKSVGGAGVGSTLDDRTRDACLHSLGDQYAAGRLSAWELESRIQAALAAETDADLAEVMADVQPAPSTENAVEVPEQQRDRAQLVRWGTGFTVLAAGGVLLAVVGSGSDLLELAVGTALGLLGFLTHRWVSAGAVRAVVDPPPVEAAAPEERPAPPVLRDVVLDPAGAEQLPGPLVEPAEPPIARVRPLRPTRPLGRGDGGVPTQRSGD